MTHCVLGPSHFFRNFLGQIVVLVSWSVNVRPVSNIDLMSEARTYWFGQKKKQKQKERVVRGRILKKPGTPPKPPRTREETTMNN